MYSKRVQIRKVWHLSSYNICVSDDCNTYKNSRFHHILHFKNTYCLCANFLHITMQAWKLISFLFGNHEIIRYQSRMDRDQSDTQIATIRRPSQIGFYLQRPDGGYGISYSVQYNNVQRRLLSCKLNEEVGSLHFYFCRIMCHVPKQQQLPTCFPRSQNRSCTNRWPGKYWETTTWYSCSRSQPKLYCSKLTRNKTCHGIRKGTS